MTKNYDAAIVGGGVAGLTAALYLAKSGKKVVVLEQQDRLGGRAVTNQKKGVYFNLGGHALYRGEAYDIFQELGIHPEGKVPSVVSHGIWKNQVYDLPSGFLSLFQTKLFSLKGKMEIGGALAKIGKIDTNKIPHVSLRMWIEQNLHDPMVRHFFYSLCRTLSYAAAPDLLLAAPVIKQLQRAMKGVLYIHKGWGSFIEQMRIEASRLGVTLLSNRKVVSVEHANGQVNQVRCADGEIFDAVNVVLTTSPDIAYKLVPNAEQTSLRVWKEQAIPLTVACLDIGLRRLPNPKHQFIYGVDQPVFFTNQSRAAMLSEDGTQVVHLMKYQGTNSNAKDDEQQLEKALDLVQPGWREKEVVRQYLPKMTVVHDFMHVKRTENPGPAVPEINGLYVAGDWATHGELLVDAAAASAKRAAYCLLYSKQPLPV